MLWCIVSIVITVGNFSRVNIIEVGRRKLEIKTCRNKHLLFIERSPFCPLNYLFVVIHPLEYWKFNTIIHHLKFLQIYSFSIWKYIPKYRNEFVKYQKEKQDKTIFSVHLIECPKLHFAKRSFNSKVMIKIIIGNDFFKLHLQKTQNLVAPLEPCWQDPWFYMHLWK